MIGNNFKSKKGFTLVEVIVGMGIFGVILALGSAVLLSTIYSQRGTRAFQGAIDELGFSLETVSREIRAGRGFSLGGSSTLNFTNADDKAVVYNLQNSTIMRSEDSGATFKPVTGSGINISYLEFQLSGQASGDGLQPKIVILIQVKAQAGPQRNVVMNIQRTLSARHLDTP